MLYLARTNPRETSVDAENKTRKTFDRAVCCMLGGNWDDRHYGIVELGDI